MKQSDFEKQFHWLYGLREYFQHIDKQDRYEELFKAVYQGNWYRKRDLMLEFTRKEDANALHVKSWMNILIHEHLDDVVIKPQLMATMIRHLMKEDPLMCSIVSFISYFASDDDDAAFVPDLNDFLSRGQVRSKLWMMAELKNILEDDYIGNIVVIGGWYNFLAHFFFNDFTVNKIYSIDVDERVVEPSKRLYPHQVEQGSFLPLVHNINDLEWSGKTLRRFDMNDRRYYDIDTFNCVVNTSCEHMDNTWFERLPEGTFVVLQTNDYFSNPQHSNCCKDLADAVAKYPMTHVMYQGELDTHLYNRFMVIGVK